MGLTTDWSPREKKKSKSEDGLIKSYMKNTEKKDFKSEQNFSNL